MLNDLVHSLVHKFVQNRFSFDVLHLIYGINYIIYIIIIPTVNLVYVYVIKIKIKHMS
jgi:hypothetical protein